MYDLPQADAGADGVQGPEGSRFSNGEAERLAYDLEPF
jgi:hypothetical protein